MARVDFREMFHFLQQKCINDLFLVVTLCIYIKRLDKSELHEDVFFFSCVLKQNQELSHNKCVYIAPPLDSLQPLLLTKTSQSYFIVDDVLMMLIITESAFERFSICSHLFSKYNSPSKYETCLKDK